MQRQAHPTKLLASVVIITNYTKQASRLSNCVGYFYMGYLEYVCFLVKPVAKAVHVLVPACSMVNVTCHIVYMLTPVAV